MRPPSWPTCLAAADVVVPADENTALAGQPGRGRHRQRPLADEPSWRGCSTRWAWAHSSLRLDERTARQPVCGYDVDFDEIAVTAGSEVVLDAAYGLVSTLDDLALLGAALADPSRLHAGLR